LVQPSDFDTYCYLYRELLDFIYSDYPLCADSVTKEFHRYPIETLKLMKNSMGNIRRMVKERAK
jgi:hypothetical protein